MKTFYILYFNQNKSFGPVIIEETQRLCSSGKIGLVVYLRLYLTSFKIMFAGNERNRHITCKSFEKPMEEHMENIIFVNIKQKKKYM